MGSLRKYDNRYRPRICTARAVLYYYKITDESRVLTPKTHKRHLEAKEIEIDFLLVVLNEDNESPTEKMYFDLINKCWNKYAPKKADLKEHKAFVIITKIINEHGRVNYDFDELND
jgi:hypothetical protein